MNHLGDTLSSRLFSQPVCDAILTSEICQGRLSAIMIVKRCKNMRWDDRGMSHIGRVRGQMEEGFRFLAYALICSTSQRLELWTLSFNILAMYNGHRF